MGGAASLSRARARHATVDGALANERVTALAGVVLLALIVVEVVCAARLQALMTVHIAGGVALAGPLAVKLASTGYRFARYYLGAPAYRRRGPPVLVLRVLAPALVALTVVLVATGFGLLAVGPVAPGPLVFLHNVSALVWLPLVGVHAAAYVARLPELVAADLAPPPAVAALTGRLARLTVNGGALLLGLAAALLLLPAAAPWAALGASGEPVPAPLILGGVVTMVIVGLTRPRRWTGR